MSEQVNIVKREIFQRGSSVRQCLTKPARDGLKFVILSDQTSLVRRMAKLKFILREFDFPTGSII